MTRFLLALALAALPLVAQNSSLQGIVTDGQGSAVPGAVVTITNTDTSAVRKALTDSVGAYSILQVTAGPYKVLIEKPGFRAHSTDMVFQTETPESLNVKLEVGQVTETVNVTGEAAVVNTETAAVGNPYNETQVREIPLQTRNVVSLLGLEPGVAPSGQVGGAKPDQNNITLDGINVNNVWGGNGFGSSIPIPLDSVQEFRTTVAGVGADQGFSAGGQASIVTKGGSNNFHGSLYEYNRNTLTSANSWSNNRAGLARPALVRNQFGASLGGPILKNKLFFFYNYEGRTDRSANSETDQVPSPTLQQGIVEVQLKTSNQILQLTPAMIQAIDPLGIGENPYIASLIKQYPAGNYAQGGSDKGLNFYGLLFNAPNTQNYHTQVGKLDYNLDPNGKHVLSLSGTLNGQVLAGALAQFPGQSATSSNLDNSRRFGARYTFVISSHLVNNLNYGYTRPSTASTGVTIPPVPSFGFTQFQATPRASRSITPYTNVTDDLTWTKGRHTIQFGVNLLWAENDHLSYSNYETFSYNRATLLGLGADIDADVLSVVQQIVPGAQLASTTNVTNAFGAVFGIMNNWSGTAHYLVNGTPIPFGSPFGTDFESNEYEGYAQDTFKVKRNFTLTYGVRYSHMAAPYEKNGQQLNPITPLSEYFAQRVGAQEEGIPNYALPTAQVSYAPAGKVNNGAPYYPTDNKLFSPRIGLAYTPESGSLLERILGKGSAFRVGDSIMFDHYGNALAEAFSSGGSPGLSSSLAQPVNTNFTTSPRFNGSNLPTLIAPVNSGFPYTPPTIFSGFTTFTGIQTDLKAPYEYVMNATYARPLPHRLSIELGYVGRLGRRGLLQQDFGQPLGQFKDPVSGQTLAQAAAPLATLYNNMINSGMTSAQVTAAVKANPSLVPVQPFFANMFPNTKSYYLPNGGQSANFFYDWYAEFGGSFLDTLNDMDRFAQPSQNGGCFSVFGCHTFFPLQNSGLESYTNTGTSSYNAATIVLRRAVQKGWGFNFDYTFGHALDNGSASESSGGAALQDAFNPGAFKGPSDFDARSRVSFDYVVEVPVGKGKAFGNSMPKVLDYAIGGWQVSGITSFSTGTPLTITGNNVYNTNYEYTSYAILNPGTAMPKYGLTTDQNGYPSIFSNTSAVNDFVASFPGSVGTRGIMRGFNSFNTDLAISKYFHIKEKYRLQLRAEGFNAFNRVNYNNPGLSLASITTFGETTSAASARVMQFAGRFEF